MALLHDLPDLSSDSLAGMGSRRLLSEARELFRAGAVRSVNWEKPVVEAQIMAEGKRFDVRLNLRSLTFVENRCDCDQGRRGYVCVHALAACIALSKQRDAALDRQVEAARQQAARAEVKPRASEAAPVREKPQRALKSLKLGEQGEALYLAFLLPPNIERAAERNMISVKLELHTGGRRQPPEKLFKGARYRLEPAHLEAAKLVEGWCGGELHSLLTLKGGQLVQLLKALQGQSAFYWVNQPGKALAWEGKQLAGVSAHLASEAEAVPQKPMRRQVPVQREAVSSVERFQRELRKEPGLLQKMEVDGSPFYLAIRLPSKDDPLYLSARELLNQEGFRLEPSNQRFWLRDQHKVLNFLSAHWDELKERFGALFTANFEKQMQGIRLATLEAQAEALVGEHQLQLRLKAGEASDDELRQALASNQRYVTRDEAIYLLPQKTLTRMAEAQQALTGVKSQAVAPSLTRSVTPAALSDVQGILEEADAEIELPETWLARSAALRNMSSLRPAPLPTALDQQLRSYQRIGVAWLWHLFQNDLGGVLADEMGLGKTVQALGMLLAAWEAHPDLPLLVVCPAGLVENWRREAVRFAPELQPFCHHRERRLPGEDSLLGQRLVITSYATLTRDIALFEQARYSVIIADEAQHIKNRRTQSARALRSLQAQGRFVLTGTPIENSLDDLRSLFSFIMPGYLAKVPADTAREDRAWYDERHREQAAPYILRRNKRLVAPELPEKLEQVVPCEMGARQRKVYEEVRQKLEKQIEELEYKGASESQVRMAALTQLLRLRQVCAEPRILAEELKDRDSAKLNAFREILDEAVDGGHRMLVFSQFVTVLQHLRTYLEAQGHAYCYLDGSTHNRQEVCDRFNGDDSIPVFLISLKAGGTGLNLTGADTVVHYDPWWNPAVEAQATDRAHRIGQTRTVQVYKLITNDTVEDKVMELQLRKSEILKDLLDESAARTAKVSLDDIKSLIRWQ